MPKYHVTGGPTGDASVEIRGKTHKAGDSFEASPKDAKDLKWLVDGGYLSTEAASKNSESKDAATAAADEEEEAKDGDE